MVIDKLSQLGVLHGAGAGHHGARVERAIVKQFTFGEELSKLKFVEELIPLGEGVDVKVFLGTAQ